jgi:VIT1/CCC1 family predicted Fe2+/Mn2+ transporter
MSWFDQLVSSFNRGRASFEGISPQVFAGRLRSKSGVNYLRDWIYGGIDGAITTFAILAGVAGANLSAEIMLIVGLANLLADGFALAAGDYSATKSERDDYERLRAQEQAEIRDVPESEREEIRQIFRAKGFTGEDLERVVKVITADDQRWVSTMLKEEHGLPAEIRSPTIAALTTFSAFGICGAVPLIPVIFNMPHSLVIAGGLTAIVFFTIGGVKSRWSVSNWYQSELETLVIGMTAALIAYGIGAGLNSLVAV